MNKVISIDISEVKTQREMIMYHLQKDSYITSIEAFSDYGITRLSSIIHTLRKEGYEIVSIPITTTNRFGNSVNYSRYSYTKPNYLQQLDLF
tara:strand:- start:2191 stop:2466 length:276 start_codon:yes stop_codon:yes gene_type:complete